MKIYFYTFGCKVNQYETENIKQAMEKKSFSVTDNYSSADIAVINTCTVTSRSDMKCRQLIHKIKKSNPECIIVLTGCFPQAFSDKAEAMSECSIITGASNKSSIPGYIDEYILNRRRIISIQPHEIKEKFESMSNVGVPGKTRAYMKIQDGCDQYCTYCIIPFTRGHIRSKPLEVIKAEAKALADSGHKEIVVVGINLWCYGKDFNDKAINLVDAIEAISENAKSCRIRLGSVEPEMVTDDDIKRLSELKNFCPHFHLSLQSGCDKTLKSMNRKYTCSQYEALCKKLREAFKDCAITTDIMVGFAGESDSDFEESMRFVEKIGFSKAHIFPYSIRKGTAAAKMGAQLSNKEKQQRAAKMDIICKKQQHEFLNAMIGQVHEVLFEKEKSDFFHQGYTPNYTLVKVPRISKDISLKRKIFDVLITETNGEYCTGQIVEKQIN